MNNTSAYANVLLKPSVAAPVVAAPKRDYQDDLSPADFHQTLKDAHESQQRQNEKAYKSASHKKTAQTEHHNDVKKTKEIKDSKAIGEKVAEQKPLDKTSNIYQNAKGADAVHKQPEEYKSKDVSANEFTAEPDQDPSNLGVEPPAEMSQSAVQNQQQSSLQNVQIVAIPAMDLSSSASVLDEELTATTSTIAPIADILPTAVESATQQEAMVVQAQSSLAKPALEAPVLVNNLEPDTNNLMNEALSADASIDVEKKSDAVAPLSVSDEPSLAQNVSQPLANTSQAAPVNQPINSVAPADVQVLAAGAMASAKASQAVLAEMSDTSPVSEETIDLLTPSVSEISASAKATPATNPVVAHNAASPDVTTAQAQMSASKTAFEKTLQAVASPDAKLADDMTASALTSGSTSSTTNSLMDSLMRGADQQTPAARNFVVQTAVPVPVGQPQWSQAVGEKVLWLAAQNVSSAEINLHPKDLGPIQVRVSVNQEQTTVNFTSHHAVVREVLDQNLNRLRDMFSEQGLNLVNVDVSDKSFSRQQGDAQDQKAQSGSQDLVAEEETAVAMSAIVQQRLVDHYA